MTTAKSPVPAPQAEPRPEDHLQHAEKRPQHSKPYKALRRFLAILGPGLITGAADDDPSGISTYSVTGAAYGYATLWVALLTFPLMTAVQLMCARLGIVTGRGLAGIRAHVLPALGAMGRCAILAVANIINIGADLGGMAEATQLVTGIHMLVWIPIYAVLIVVPDVLGFLQTDGGNLQVDDAGSVRVCLCLIFRAR